MTNTSLNLRDFYPFSSWSVTCEGPCFEDGTPLFITDTLTKKHYLNENSSVIRTKCFLLSVGTPIIHLIMGIARSAFKLLEVISILMQGKHFTLKERLHMCKTPLIEAVTSFLAPFFLELAALYGLVLSPHNGRKLYASFENLFYGNFILAPCFQPAPERHFFGGSLAERNAF